jgi:hypothetical protein
MAAPAVPLRRMNPVEGVLLRNCNTQTGQYVGFGDGDVILALEADQGVFAWEAMSACRRAKCFVFHV